MKEAPHIRFERLKKAKDLKEEAETIKRREERSAKPIESRKTNNNFTNRRF